jgi:hypothetical protein
MKLIKFLIYILITVFLVVILNIIIPSTGDSEKQKIDSLFANKDKIESVTLGRSHAASIDYTCWDLKGVNFALGGRDLASINYQMEYFIENFPKIKEILISISYSSLYYDNESLAHGNLNDARKSLYYSIPIFSVIDNHDINNFVFGKFFPFMQADHGYAFFKNYSSKNKPFINNSVHETDVAFIDSVQMIQNSLSQANLHSIDRKTAESYNPNVVQKNISYLKNIIVNAKKNKINLIFFTPPYHYLYTKNFPQKDIIEMKNVMKDLTMEYKTIYIDYSIDSILSMSNKFYHNADHMNGVGRQMFTKSLFSKLKQLNIKK